MAKEKTLVNLVKNTAVKSVAGSMILTPLYLGFQSYINDTQFFEEVHHTPGFIMGVVIGSAIWEFGGYLKSKYSSRKNKS